VKWFHLMYFMILLNLASGIGALTWKKSPKQRLYTFRFISFTIIFNNQSFTALLKHHQGSLRNIYPAKSEAPFRVLFAMSIAGFVIPQYFLHNCFCSCRRRGGLYYGEIIKYLPLDLSLSLNYLGVLIAKKV